MVSNSLDMELEELLQIVERMRQQYAGEAEYQKMRAELPQEWPL
jgi:hypothetical protein